MCRVFLLYSTVSHSNEALHLAAYPAYFNTAEDGILLIHSFISGIQNLCNQDFEIVTWRVLSLN